VIPKTRLFRGGAPLAVLLSAVWYFAMAPVWATTLAGSDRKIDLIYDISWGALHLAEATSQWRLSATKAVITGTVKSDGIAALISGFESASTAEIDYKNQQWEPGFLSLSRVTKSKQVASSVHWSAGGRILSDIQQPPLDLDDVFPISEAMKQQVIDPYTAIMRQLDQIAASGRCGGSYAVYDGLRRFEMQFDSQGPTLLEADRPTAYGGEALLCGIIVMPRGGHRLASNWHKKSNDERRVLVYFGHFADDLILPVRIEVKASLGTGIARLDMARSLWPGQ